MAETKDYLDSFAQLSRTQIPEERRSLWRQGMATLARAAVAQQPVPLEGINPELLLRAVIIALESNFFEELDWLSPAAAAAAIYELAAALPLSQERRELGRRVLIRLLDGDAETFIVLATSLASDSKRTIADPAIQARIRLAFELPVYSGTAPDGLALTLISRSDLQREWLLEPSQGSLPSRRFAARILERAARESLRRVALGDHGSLKVFQEPEIKKAWKRLLDDRESLVWRHVAVARGLLSRVILEYEDEIEGHLSPELTPTEWRRAAVSLTASIALDPAEALESCREFLRSDVVNQDKGLAGTMIFGLSRAADTEPEAAEEILDEIVRVGGLEIAEALVELRREHTMNVFGERACQYTQGWLRKVLAIGSERDDGRVALCEALIDELSPRSKRVEQTLRDRLDAALMLFVEQSAPRAHAEATSIYQEAQEKIGELEQYREEESASRRNGFRALRELDIGLLENTTLSDLLNLRAKSRNAEPVSAAMDLLFERLTKWLVRVEGDSIKTKGAVSHLTLRLRRCRTLLHMVDAEGTYVSDNVANRRDRRIQTATLLFKRVQEDASTPLARVVCAALARACDALVRDGLFELSDVFIITVDSIQSEHHLTILAEASMNSEFQSLMISYRNLMNVFRSGRRSGYQVRAALDALAQMAQGIAFASTLRVNALRIAIIRLVQDLEAIASAVCVDELTEGSEGTAVERLRNTVYTLAQLTSGARWRLGTRGNRAVPASSSGLRMLDIAIIKSTPESSDMLDEVLSMVSETIRRELPLAIAETVIIVLERIPLLIKSDLEVGRESFIVPSPREEPLPHWLPAHRTLGGFYVVRPLGVGGVGSVFVVTRVEERHETSAENFALKVPDYKAEAARTLSEEEFLKLFRDEAGALLSLPIQRNLAKFVTFDAGTRPKPILVMEFVPGPTLEKVIERSEIDTKQAFALLDGIGEGIACMHRAGISHLDVKPSNVILRQTPGANGSNQQTPVLVDFGLAGRRLRPGCATGPYGAPEIWGLFSDDYRDQPMAADTYAYACLVFEVLTGEVLFQAPNELATINAHLAHDGYPNKLRRLSETPEFEPLCNLIASALRQRPDNRISASQLRDSLNQISTSFGHLSWPLRPR
ncbi:MAG: protein kinase [Deltaproteobacteria bacterium]|nr:protein kinase [Deltaproteobacteria bacterium]